MLRRQLALLFMLSAAVTPSPATGQSDEINDVRPTVQAIRLKADESIVLDGAFSEPAWQRAQPATGFTQQEPREGRPSTERTEVRIVYDEAHLYIGALLYDREPDGIMAYQRRRDEGLDTDDRFMWILDTYQDERNAYFFEINPAGLRGDGLLSTGQGSNLNKSWDGIWDVAVTRTQQGWAAEIRIPFRTLNFDPDRTTWGINFQRTIRRKSEEALWSGHRRNQGLFRPQDAGTLTGLEGLSQGLGLEVKPYGLASANRTWAADGATTEPLIDGGLDLTYSLTTNLRASLTVNTDFAEAEVDQRRVNLTRFPLFFPEKRDFFLEGSSVFSFAPSSNQYPYFSRRIGLMEGTPIPILLGGRLAGRVGAYNVGFLQVRTRRQDDVPAETFSTLPAEDFTVVRVVRNVWAESQIGAIYTRRATHSDAASFDSLDTRHTVGADLELGTSRFLGNRNLQFQAFFVWHNAPTPQDTLHWGHRTTRGVRLTYPNQPWLAHVSYREFGDAYDPAVGFVQRRGIRRLQPSITYAPILENNRYIRQLSFGLYFEYLMGLDFRPQTVTMYLPLPSVRFESGDEVTLELGRTFERLTAPFDILRDGRLVLSPGDYAMWAGRFEVRSASYRPVAGVLEVEHGDFWSGRRTRYALGLTVKPLAGVSVGGDWEHSRVDLPAGHFTTHLLRFAGSMDLTPWTSLTTHIQYDNLSGIVGLFGRFRWIIRPGSDLYLVYTHNWLSETRHLVPLENQATAKVTYTHRF